jgi:spore germination cell wall hydrolase CwlJ-like protein
MNRNVRAGGIAAAVLGLALSFVPAAPSEAGQVTTSAATASYLDHAGATIDSSAAPNNQINADDQTGINGDIAAHSAARIAGELVAFAENAVPRARSLPEMVSQLAHTNVPDEQQHCLAGAVYFEARGEPIEGQLAVAEVVLNRAASGKYPSTICEVVTQKAQFSFIEDGEFPPINYGSKAWRKAAAIAEIARRELDSKLKSDVLWYHADYVAPSWGKRLSKEKKIGLHIFYS